MNLIDYFNQFEAASEQWHFSANTRSLYIAILSQFNRAFYPAEMYLLNGELQKMSGIFSNSSFDAARGALIASKLITYKKSHYALCAFGNGLENEWKPNGNGVENAKVDFIVQQKEYKRQETITTTTTAKARTCEAEAEGVAGVAGAVPPEKSVKIARGNGVGESEKISSPSTNSPEVQQTWFRCTGEAMGSYFAQDMLFLENEVGTEILVQAIVEGYRSNTAPRLSYKFVKAIAQRIAAERYGKPCASAVSSGRKNPCEKPALALKYGGEDEFLAETKN